MIVKTREDFEQFKSQVKLPIVSFSQIRDEFHVVDSHGCKFTLPQNCRDYVNKNATQFANDLVFGKDKRENIVAVEVKNDKMYLYKEVDNKVILETQPMIYWICANTTPSGEFSVLDGYSPIRYMKEFSNFGEWTTSKSKLYGGNVSSICPNLQEQILQKTGMTFFKGLKLSDVSILAFDIETTTINPKEKNATILTIANTFRRGNNVERKLFKLPDYKNCFDMILDWCKYVRDTDPSIITGHNINRFDLPYINEIYLKEYKETLINEFAPVYGEVTVRCEGEYQYEEYPEIKASKKGIPLGRDGSSIVFAKKDSEFRKDGDQGYSYKKISCFGRNIIDGMFLAVKYDIGRQFESYGLKSIVEAIGQQKEDRIKWDFDKYPTRKWKEWSPEVWKMFEEYNMDDADDSIKIFDLMAPSLFYMNQSIPVTFQNITESATGAQWNKMITRGYIQSGHSLPLPTETNSYEGAISFGVPGIYKNVAAFDARSLYPSIMLQYNVYDKVKDPLRMVLTTLEYFTNARIKYKQLFKETKDRYYDDLQGSFKTLINSCYGFGSTNGLHFNSPKCASSVTAHGREIITKAMIFLTGNDINYWKEYAEKHNTSEE